MVCESCLHNYQDIFSKCFVNIAKIEYYLVINVDILNFYATLLLLYTVRIFRNVTHGYQ